jgi:hypothetical protein
MNDTKFIVGVGIAVVIMAALIMVVPAAYEYFFPKDKGYTESTYNGFTVLNISGSYYTQIKMPERNRSHNIQMRLPPDMVDDIPIETGIKEHILAAEGLYLTTETDLGAKTVVAMVEIGKIVGDRYDILNIPTVTGLTAPVPNQPDRQVIGCSNATREVPVLLFLTGPETVVFKRDDCVIVQGKTEDELIEASIKLGYVLLGIIQNA